MTTSIRNNTRPTSSARIILVIVALVSVAIAVYVAESNPKRKIHSGIRVYQDALSYNLYSLEPYVSGETMDYHYNKHDYGYDKKLQTLVNNTDLADLTLLEIIERNTSSLPAGVYNNAGQLLNHNIFWKSLTPDKEKQYPLGLSESLKSQIVKDFKTFDGFVSSIKAKSVAWFGSGWTYVVFSKSANRIDIINTQNGNYPSGTDYNILFNLDIWEHAYYIDYRNERDVYVSNIMNVVNWAYASENFSL